MDTAQKLLKTSALLFAVALLMAAPGWAQPALIVPASVTIGFTGSNSASVISSVAGTPITYAVEITYPGSNSSGSWLVVNGPTTTGTTEAPAFLTFSLRNNSTAGVTNGASATVTLHPTAPTGVLEVTIAVNFDGASGGGSSSATVTASATTVNLTAAANSPAFTTVNITTNSVSTIALNATASVSLGVVNWLSVSPDSSTLNSGGGSTLTITANANGLTSGFSYQGTVTVTPSTGPPVTISVVFSVAAIVGNGVWSASPGSTGWNFATNSAVYPSQAITVTTTSASPTYSVITTSDNWLLAYTSGNSGAQSINGIGLTTPFGLRLGSQANALAAGTYTGTAAIYDSGGILQIAVSVTLTVTSGSATGFTVTPSSVSFTAPLDGAQQSQTVNVTSGAGGALSVSGTLPSGLSYQLPADTTVAAGGSIGFTVYGNPAGLAANTYAGTLNVVVGAQSAALTVTMIVGGGGTGTTAVAPTALNFSYQLGTDAINFIARRKLVITGPAGAWSSTISTSNGVNWLRVTPSNGTSLPNPANASETPIVSVDATGLTVGTHGGTITITTPGGGTQSIAVSLIVGSGTVLLPTDGALIFTAQTGQAKPSGQGVYFSGSNGALNPLAISAESNNTWIAVTNDATSISVQVDQTGLTTGVYSGSVSVSQAGADNSPTAVPVLLVVNGGGSGGSGGTGGGNNVTVTPASLTFSAQSGSSPATQTLSVNSATGSAGVSFIAQVSAGISWLSTNAAASNTTPVTNLTVSVISGMLAAGSYTGNILITPTGGSPVNVPVYLTILVGATAVTATPTTLTFDYRAGDSTPSPKQLTVSGGGAALAFSATPATGAGSWLVVSPASGTTTATGTTVDVSINPTGLSTGVYNGTVLVAGASGATGSTIITVTLNVTAPLPTLTKVTNAASYATGSIAPGEIITLFAGDPTHPIGPAAAAGLTLDSTGKVSTTIGGVQVLVNGFACPMIYASASQVSAVVPYELKLFTTATVLVRFLGQTSNGVPVNVGTTAPGLFTANSSGTGPGAILNSNNSYNSPANPATPGDAVVVYLTGEGETSPGGITGKVTTLAAPPLPLTPAPLLPVSVTIGGQPADWTFAGEAPGFVSGAMQLNVTVPTSIAAGEQSIVVTIGGNQSQQGVTVSVR